MIAVEEIWDYVKPRVSETARHAGNEQTPVLQGRLTAGLALTVNLAELEYQQEMARQETAQKLEKLQSLFETDQLSAEHFGCAFTMIESGQSNRYLDSLLNDKLQPKLF